MDKTTDIEGMTLLKQWQQSGWLNALDIALARLVTAPAEGTQQTDGAQSVLALMTALLSYQVLRGHVCLDLEQLLDHPHALLSLSPVQLKQMEEAGVVTPASQLSQLKLPDIEALLSTSVAVTCIYTTTDGSSQLAEQAVNTPLVYAAGALYLRRFWLYEKRISDELRGRMNSSAMQRRSGDALSGLLNELFPVAQTEPQASPLEQVSWQKLACANTLRSRFSVITGGPGTGKTYTVVRLLALLQRLAMTDHGQGLRIRLAAPTGKAAARLKESIQSALSEMLQDPHFASWHDTLQQIDGESSTLHKLLGTQQQTRAFRHHSGNRLSLDVLVIDEASMVDIEMMDAVLAALPKTAQLILLGDKDQLASVEAGAVLGQLCAGAEEGRYREESFDYLQSVSDTKIPLQLFDADGPDYLQHVVMLRVSRRFDGRSGIGHLANAVNAGDVERLRELLPQQQSMRPFADIELLSVPSATATQDTEASLLEDLRPLCVAGFKAYWQKIQQRPDKDAGDSVIERWAREVLQTYTNFQLLTPLREGTFGVAGLNQQIERWLTFMPKTTLWYEGRPVIVSQNDYSLNLRNGDIGMVLKWPRDDRERVVFIDSDGRLRWILPSRLRQVNTVFAMTVHKSQGSEFAHTVMVMPSVDNPVLCRELVYTGITRAAKQLTLVVPRWDILEQAVRRQTYRSGNLNLRRAGFTCRSANVLNSGLYVLQKQD